MADAELRAGLAVAGAFGLFNVLAVGPVDVRVVQVSRCGVAFYFGSAGSVAA